MFRPTRASGCLLLGVVLCAGDATADFFTGNELLGKCKQEAGSVDLAVCSGYLTGVAASSQYNRSAFPGKPSKQFWSHRDVCIPDGVTIGQLKLVWMKSAESYPQDLHNEAVWLVLRAFGEAWPCK